MNRRDWKRLRPTNFSHAMELCLEHGRATKNRSVDRVAELMGLPNKWVIYKWMESGRMPGNLIPSFENVCDVGYVTQWLAQAANKLLIAIPTGRNATAKDIHELQAVAHDAVGLLIRFYQQQASADETLSALNGLMQDLAWHRINVEKFTQPELALMEGDDD